MENAIKVLLVDDHPILRSGLKALLNREPNLDVVGEASNGRDAVKLANDLSPDVVVMDLRMPDLNGIDASRQLMAQHPGLKIVALSAISDERTMSELLRSGAVGFVPKEAAFEELITAIRTIIKGKVYFDPSTIARMADNGASNGNSPAHEAAYRVLSSREREVLQLIAEGKSTKEVAACLDVSIKTAETHRRNLMEKLNLDSVAELTKYAIREGLTSV